VRLVTKILVELKLLHNLVNDQRAEILVEGCPKLAEPVLI